MVLQIQIHLVFNSDESIWDDDIVDGEELKEMRKNNQEIYFGLAKNNPEYIAKIKAIAREAQERNVI